MNPTRNKRPSRERRVWRVMWKMVAAAVLLSTVGLGIAVLKSRTQGTAYHFLGGFSLGVICALPAGMALFLYRAYRVMDEFGKRLQEKACTFAFVVSMVGAATGYALSTGTGFTFPLWALYLLGMAAYTIAVVQGSLAARGGRE